MKLMRVAVLLLVAVPDDTPNAEDSASEAVSETLREVVMVNEAFVTWQFEDVSQGSRVVPVTLPEGVTLEDADIYDVDIRQCPAVLDKLVDGKWVAG